MLSLLEVTTDSGSKKNITGLMLTFPTWSRLSLIRLDIWLHSVVTKLQRYELLPRIKWGLEVAHGGLRTLSMIG